MTAGRVVVLLVEDDPEEREAIAAKLPAAGFSVVPVDGLGAARDALGECAFDVALLDLYLCDSKGLDTLEHFKSLCNGLPTLVLTGTRQDLLDSGLYEQALKMGAADCLHKDAVTDVALLRAIQRETIRAQEKLDESQTTLRIVSETATRQDEVDRNLSELRTMRERMGGQ